MRAGRRRLSRAGLGAVIAAAVLLAQIGISGAAEAPQAARDAIRSALEAWRSAFNDRDEDRVCDLFAPDLIANYQGQPERDYASLCQLLQRSAQDRSITYRYSLEIKEILVFGATAVVRLVWTLEIEKAGTPKETIEEPAIDIFRRQPDGAWKISRYLAYPATR